jgi:GntR family transcriptional regulator
MGTSTDPVYLRVLEDLRMRIREGTLEPGARVPSRNAIITRYGVGETAAKHALQVLASEGLIEARAGSGSYVRQAATARDLEHDRPAEPGSPFGVDGGEYAEPQSQPVIPPAHIARRLGLPPGGRAIATQYLLTCGGDPVQLTISYEPPGRGAGPAGDPTSAGPVPAAAAAGPDAAAAAQGVAERMRAVGIEVDQVVEEVSVRPALQAEATALAIPAGAPVIVVERVHLAGERAVAAADIVTPADRARLRYRFRPGPDAPGGPDQLG